MPLWGFHSAAQAGESRNTARALATSQTCNNKKNTVCRNCLYEHKCDGCILAFPEKVRSQTVVLILDRETIEGLGVKFGTDVENKLSKIIREIATSRNRE